VKIPIFGKKAINCCEVVDLWIKADMTYGELKPPKPVKPKDAWALRKEYEKKKKAFFKRALAEWRKEQRKTLKLLTSEDVCDIFEISERTLLRWRRTGGFPYKNINGTIRYLPSDIKKYVEKL